MKERAQGIQALTRVVCAILCPRRFKIVVITAGVLLLIFAVIQLNHPMWFQTFRIGAKTSRHCTPTDVQDDMLKLTYDVHVILKDLNVTHFLLYGSLWGALRMNAPLPWDVDVDLGMIPDGQYNSLSETQFLEKFEEKGMKITNNMQQKTSFKFERGKGALDLIIYYEHGDWMKRKGWESWVMIVHFNLHHTFPKILIEQRPLPEKMFGWFMMPVPQNGIEIMKHMYRYNWWITYHSEGC